jgi:hypothetical protein
LECRKGRSSSCSRRFNLERRDMEHSLTGHARKRAQQRGIRLDVIDFVIQHADVDLEAGDGCRSLRISKRGLAMLGGDCTSLALSERAANVVVLVAADGDVVTVMHDCNSQGRRYRRQYPTRKRPITQYSRAA